MTTMSAQAQFFLIHQKAFVNNISLCLGQESRETRIMLITWQDLMIPIQFLCIFCAFIFDISIKTFNEVKKQHTAHINIQRCPKVMKIKL